MKFDFQQLHLDPTWTLTLVRAGDAFRYQHVVQPHQLGVRGVLRVKVAVTEKKNIGFLNMDQILAPNGTALRERSNL